MYNAEERFSILEQRDKKLRELRKRRGVEDGQQVMRGSCPDMCPEKERYLREYGKQLSIFEQTSGSDSRADHDRMVKEYSRSSADQEEPLAHELRPSRVLKIAMNYLLSNIVNLLPNTTEVSVEATGKHTESFVQLRNIRVGIGEWYQFLWDRMRAIRKDITQQRLADRATVELIEKCARFHIFCSSRLCAEAEHDFDAKLNQQNLENCLQTLKELYDDAYERIARSGSNDKKSESIFRNELEFRSYMLLMYVQDSSTFNRHLLSMRPEMRAAPEIQRCVEVYRAYFANNFVRFFRLVAALPPLHASLLHRAFLTVRISAASMLHRSFGFGPPKSNGLPLRFVADLLGFDSENDAARFCRLCSLQVERAASEGEAPGEMQVVLDRSVTVNYQEGPWNRMRAIRLIESKITVSVGELINGEPLPLVKVAPLHSSFDQSGRFVPRSMSRQDSIRSEQSASSIQGIAQAGNDEQDAAEEGGEDEGEGEAGWDDADADGEPLENMFDPDADYEAEDGDYDQDGESGWLQGEYDDAGEKQSEIVYDDTDNQDDQFADTIRAQFEASIVEKQLNEAVEHFVEQVCQEVVDEDLRCLVESEVALAVREREHERERVRRATAMAELRESMVNEAFLTVSNECIDQLVRSIAREALSQLQVEAELVAKQEFTRQYETVLLDSIVNEVVTEGARSLAAACRRKIQLAERGQKLLADLQRSAMQRHWNLWKNQAAKAFRKRTISAESSLGTDAGVLVTFSEQPVEIGADSKQQLAAAAAFRDNLTSEKFNYDRVFRNLLDDLTLRLQPAFNVVIRIGVAIDQPECEWLLYKLRNVEPGAFDTLPKAISGTLIGSFRRGLVDLEIHDVKKRNLSTVPVPFLTLVRVRSARKTLLDRGDGDADTSFGEAPGTDSCLNRPIRPFCRNVQAPIDEDSSAVRKFYAEFVMQLAIAVADSTKWVAQAYGSKQLVFDYLFEAASAYLNDKRQFDATDFVNVLMTVIHSGARVADPMPAYFGLIWHVTDLYAKFATIEQFLVDLFTVDPALVVQLERLTPSTLRTGLLDLIEQLFRSYSMVRLVAIFEAQLAMIAATDDVLARAANRNLSQAEWMRLLIDCFEQLLRHKVTVWLAIIENQPCDGVRAVQLQQNVQEILRERRIAPVTLTKSKSGASSHDEDRSSGHRKRVHLDHVSESERCQEFSDLYRRIEHLREAIKLEKTKVRRTDT